MLSIVAKHPQRAVIDEMILSGISLRKIAQTVTPPINPQALHRYKLGVIRPAIHKEIAVKSTALEVTTAALQVSQAADPFLLRMAEDKAERDRAKRLALPVDAQTAEDCDLKAFAAVDRNGISATELEARLAGRLDSGTHINIHADAVLMLPQPGRPAPRTIDATTEE